MKNRYFNYKGALFSIATASVIFAGCGSNDIDDVYPLEKETNYTYTVKVVDDAIKGATVVANECNSYEELADGYYKLSGCYSKPKAIISSGGYITLDGNTTQMDFPLILNTEMFEGEEFTITPLTTLLSTAKSHYELNQIKEALGFDNIQDMFKDTRDDADKTKIQQQINAFFINAKNSGLDLNKFGLLAQELRDNIIAKKDEANPLAVVQAAQKKFKDDFLNDGAKKAQYLEMYGIVFSGFVTQTNFNETNPKSFLSDISQKYKTEKNSLVFSGFVYDDIIGESSDKYNTNATVKLVDLNTSDEIFNIQANDYGSWNIKDVNISKIQNDNLYSFESSIENIKDKNNTIVLKSLLKGSEILDKYKSKVNTSDLPDLTISNVTTAKYACWEKKGNISDLLEFKKEFESSKQIIDLSGFIKSMVDGDTVFTGSNSYEYLLSKMDTSCNLTATNVTDLETMKSKTQNDTTLNQQFNSTVIQDFVLTEDMFKDIVISYKDTNTNKKYKLFMFANKTFILEGKDFYNIGEWSLSNNKLVLSINNQTQATNISFSQTVSVDKKTQASFKNGNFTFTEGLKARILETNNLLDIADVSKIDLTKYQAPIVKFEQDKLINKVFYEVYQDTQGNYQDRFIKLEKDGVAKVNEDLGSNELSGATSTSWSVSNGILRIGTDTYKINTATNTKIVLTKNSDLSVEFFYSSINAAASKEIHKYTNAQYLQNIALGEFAETKNNQEHNSLETIIIDSTTKLKLTSTPFNNDKNNYAYSYVVADKTFSSEKNIGTRINLSQTYNMGNSQNQSSGYVVKYNLPNCNSSSNDGELQVVVKVTTDGVSYNLKLKKSDGSIVNIFDKPVMIIDESTINKNYDTMVLYLDNKIAVRVSDGQNSYYQYTDFISLRNSKNKLLGYYKYPNKLNDLRFFNNLNNLRYPDGTSLYKEYENTKVELTINSASIISGSADDNYINKEPTTCNTESTTVTPPNNIFSGLTWEEISLDDRYKVVGNIIDFTSSKATLTTVKADNQNSRTEIKTPFSIKKSKVSATIKLLESSTEYNRVTFRTLSDIIITDEIKNGLQLGSTNVTANCVIQIKGKYLGAYILLVDSNGKEVNVFNEEMYYNSQSSDLLNKAVNITIENIQDSVVFSANADGLNISQATFTRPNGTIFSGIKGVKIRTEISDDEANDAGVEAGNIAKAEAYNILTSSYIDPNLPYSGTLTYKNLNFLKVGDLNNIEFSAKIMEDEATITPYTYISNLPTNLYSLEKLPNENMKVQTLDVSNNTLKFTDINDTNSVYNIGTYAISNDGKLIFDDREIKYAGSFNSNTLNTDTHQVFGNLGKAHVMIEKFTKNTIDIFDDINYTNGSTSIDNYISEHSDYYAPMYDIDENRSVSFAVDINSSNITSEVSTYTDINETQFESLTALDPSVLVGQTLYNLEYEQSWDNNSSSLVLGNYVENITISETNFNTTVIEAIGDDLNETSNFNIGIIDNTITETNGLFKIKYLQTIEAYQLNNSIGYDIFTFGTAHKLAFYRDNNMFEWESENDINNPWNYPKDTQTNDYFTSLDSFIETSTMSGEGIECNGDTNNMKCYVFPEGTTIADNSGSLVDRDDMMTVVGSWNYSNGIITTHITNPIYLAYGKKETPAIRINPDNGYVQRANYLAAQTGEEFYIFDEVAKTQWQDFFKNNLNTGKLQLVENMTMTNSNIGIWERKTINGLDSVLLYLRDEFNPKGNTPARSLSNGVVKEGELKEQNSTYKHYLFDETSKDEWINYINSN